ncbi:hypothetical protein Ahp2_29 [Aeromonas phage Ahp2]|nr:hypothetical protein Ahp2_29 [Aeromonas phage Ahp2]
MKKMIIAGLALFALAGCAVPVEMKQEQREQAGLLADYHKAEKAEYRATEAAKLAKGVAVAAEARKVLKQVETQKAKALLDKSLNK